MSVRVVQQLRGRRTYSNGLARVLGSDLCREFDSRGTSTDDKDALGRSNVGLERSEGPSNVDLRLVRVERTSGERVGRALFLRIRSTYTWIWYQ